MALPPMTARQRVNFLAHLWKAATQQHHREQLPLLRRYVPQDGVVFDIGGHAGQYMKLFARLAPQGKVYSFEPASYARAILSRVAKLRRLTNVELVPLALSDAVGETEIVTPLKRGGYGFGLAHLGADTSGRRVYRETVLAQPLDRFAAARGIDRLDFVKMDVEGWEVRVLKGARRTLERFRPPLMAEIVAAHLARAEDKPDDAWALLAPLGYRAARIEADGSTSPVDGFTGDADYLFTVQ